MNSAMLFVDPDNPETAKPLWPWLEEKDQVSTGNETILPTQTWGEAESAKNRLIRVAIYDPNTGTIIHAMMPAPAKMAAPEMAAPEMAALVQTGKHAASRGMHHAIAKWRTPDRLLNWKTTDDALNKCVAFWLPNDPRPLAGIIGDTGGTSLTTASIIPSYSSTSFAVVAEKLDPLAGFDCYLTKDWDGYGADPISVETVSAAKAFLAVMPATFGDPDIAPGVDGTIGLQWVLKNKPLRKLFIDIGPGTLWGAYWRKADGQTDSIKPKNFTPKLQDELRELFKRLAT